MRGKLCDDENDAITSLRLFSLFEYCAHLYPQKRLPKVTPTVRKEEIIDPNSDPKVTGVTAVTDIPVYTAKQSRPSPERPGHTYEI